MATLLIVDDNPDVRESLADALRDEGYTIVEAVNGRDGMDKLAALGEKGVVMILDLMMPVMTGWQVVAAMRASGSLERVPVIISTATPDDAPSGVRLVRKPVDLDELLAVIAEAARLAA